MAFKTRKIRKKPPFRLRSGPTSTLLKKIQSISSGLFNSKKEGRPNIFRYIWIGFLIIVASWIVIKVTFGAYRLITDFKTTAKELAFSIGTELKTDEHGYTNIVLLGDGGYQRAGAGLVDTIIVASIDHEKNAVTLLSIPRDYYVGRNGVGIGKINEVYVANMKGEGYEAYQRVAGEIANLDIQYFIRVDFNAFVEIVDSLGGITIEVKQAIYDNQYPNASDTGYAPFRVDAGVQEMDGETALKYARSRHNVYGSWGDYDRAARQQQILGAIQEKALSTDVLTSPNTLKKVYDSVQKNMDTNMTWRELVALAEFGDQFDRSHLVTKVLNNERSEDGGFLGDGSREIYGGAVVLPYSGDLEEIHRYADLIFNHRELYYDPPKLQVLNATKTTGLASQVYATLNRYGFNVVDIANYLGPDGKKQQADETILFYYSWVEENEEVIPTYHAYIDQLQKILPFVTLPANVLDLEEDLDLVLILGNDYKGLSLE